jgi:hypothetical protein
VKASLQPQIQQLQTQLGQEQQQINSQATQANAFGDARQGAEQALQNYYGNQAISGVTAQGYNTAFKNAQQAFQQDQANKLNAYNTGLQGQLQYGQLGLNAFQTALQGAQGEQGIQLQGANQMANLGQMSQALGENWGNEALQYGQQYQNWLQGGLNTAYQQFLNQSMWPYQMLNVGSQTLQATPQVGMSSTQTVPAAGGLASGIGAAASGLGGLGSFATGLANLIPIL